MTPNPRSLYRLLALACCLFALPLHAVSAPAPTDPTPAIDALFADYAKGNSPGAAVGVYHDGKLVFAKGYGLADMEAATPITPQTRFHVASVSKEFVAFSIALLAREGKVDLDADIRRYLPYVPDFGKTITVRHLILHTSGLRDQWSLFQLGGQDMDGRLRQQQILNMVARQRALNFEPGSEHLYCNTGYTLLGEIVKTVSGKTLRQFTSERIFKPLGMDHTFFFDDVEEIVPGRANSYEREDDGKPWKRSLLNYDNVGATSLFTTVEDLAKWAGNFTTPKVGDRALIEQVSHNGTLDDGTPIAYGFALVRNELGGRTVVTHSGADAAFRAIFVYYPEQDFAVAITANTPFDLKAKVAAIADLYLPASAAAPAKPVIPAEANDPATLAALAGTYLAPHERALRLSFKDGKLYRNGYGDHMDPLHLRVDGSIDDGERDNWYQPVRDGNGQLTALRQENDEGETAQVYQRAPAFDATPAVLAAYAGNYRSDELGGIVYSIAAEGDHLRIGSIWTPEAITLHAVAPDRFDAEYWALGSLEFGRDANGRVDHLLINAGRVRNVRLDRVGSPIAQ